MVVAVFIKKEKRKNLEELTLQPSFSPLFPSQKYTAIGLLGKATDTLDATGKVTEEKPYGKQKFISILDVI